MPTLLHAHLPRRRPVEAPPSDAASDAELVALAQRDPRAFTLLYVRYLDPVHRRLASREAAEDATSLVFANALSALSRYHDTAFRSWLFTIAHHVVADQYRVTHREQPLETAVELLDEAPSPEEVALVADEQRSLRDLLARLPEHQRQVVELRLAGLTGAEIAQTLGRSPANVDVTQYRAIARLRVLLGLGAGTQEATHGQ